ncbi:MAG: multicopper oxidase domain-containing protein, partial [Actinomycetota bacterium]
MSSRSRILVALAILTPVVLVVAGLALFDDDGSGGGESTAADATNALRVPGLLEPTVIDGVATLALDLDESSHTYGDGRTVSTQSYNDRSMFGPTLLWRTGDYTSIEVTNSLDGETTTTHWHGADVPAPDDGGPHSRIAPGDTWTADFPVIQPAATLWYHPHLMGTTGSSIFEGAVGMIIVEDDNPAGAELPQTYGVDDIPVILRNPDFDDAGRLAVEDEDDGDVTTVNGTFDPFVDVPAGLVRLRILNASQKTLYEISSDGDGLLVIASDGGYLEEPVRVRDLTVTPGDGGVGILGPGRGGLYSTGRPFGGVRVVRAGAALAAG